MSGPNQTRRRAVRLTAEAQTSLQRALLERWQKDDNPGKLTRETKSDLLGVSIVTAERILSGKGVDRASLLLVYKRLSLGWDDSKLETISDADSSPAKDLEVPEAEPALDRSASILYGSGQVGTMPREDQQDRLEHEAVPDSGFLTAGIMRNFGPWHPMAISGIVVLVTVCILLALLKPQVSPNRVEKIHASSPGRKYDLVRTGLDQYQKGNYASAENIFDEAVRVARNHDSAKMLAGALRLKGDLLAAKGDFGGARRAYEEAQSLHGFLHQDQTRPPLLEAVGNVDMDLGDFASAEASLTESLAGFKRISDFVGVAMVARDLGTLAFHRHNYARADGWFSTSLQAIAGQSKPEIETDVHARRALILMESGQYSKARAILKDCLGFWMTRHHPRWIAETELQLASVEAAAGQTAKARDLCATSEFAFDRIGDAGGKSQAKLMLQGLGRQGKPIP